jgi:oligosaccharide repeat unit polymerase
MFINIYVIYSCAGITIYELREKFWFNYPSNMHEVSISLVIGLFGIFFGNFISNLHSKCFISLKSRHKMEFSIKKLNIITWILIIIGNISAFILYDFYRNIPLFSENIDQARTIFQQYSAGRGTLFILQLLLILASPICYFCFMNKKVKTKINIIQFLIKLALCILPLFFYAGRFYFLTPFILTILFHTVFINKISSKKAMILGVTVFLLAISFVCYRIFGNDVNSYYAYRAIWADLFPEIRMFGFVANTIGSIGIYKEMFYNFISSLFPSIILEAIGYDKSTLLFSIGRFVSDNTGEFNVGVRTGLLGESYLAAGFYGIFILFAAIGFVLSKLTVFMKKLTKNDSRLYIIIVISLMLSLSILYGTNLLLTTIFSSFFTTVIVKYGSKRSKRILV